MVRGSLGIIEDDPVLRDNFARGLACEGFVISWCVASAAEALGAAACVVPDALIVDVGLPDADGLDLLAALRSRGLDAPAIAVTARATIGDVLLGFEAGVDDYMTKPFVFAELVARLDVLLRRTVRPVTETGLILDPLSHAIHFADRASVLTPTEYRLFAALLARGDRVLRRFSLKLAGWPAGASVSDNTLDSYVSRLRAHLRALDSSWEIETVRGVGYRIQPCA